MMVLEKAVQPGQAAAAQGGYIKTAARSRMMMQTATARICVTWLVWIQSVVAALRVAGERGRRGLVAGLTIARIISSQGFKIGSDAGTLN